MFFMTRLTVDSLYLEHSLSRTSLYVELMSRSLRVGCNLFFSVCILFVDFVLKIINYPNT